MNKFFEAVANVFRIPDLRNRVLFTLGLLAIYRLGGTSPRPESMRSGSKSSSGRTPARFSASSICSRAARSGA